MEPNINTNIYEHFDPKTNIIIGKYHGHFLTQIAHNVMHNYLRHHYQNKILPPTEFKIYLRTIKNNKCQKIYIFNVTNRYQIDEEYKKIILDELFAN